ncbi:MAG: hypothetical protein LWY06_05810 [Firmicutes bacterium]|nr:hypothetical protein [Bacillota bacterium]
MTSIGSTGNINNPVSFSGNPVPAGQTDKAPATSQDSVTIGKDETANLPSKPENIKQGAIQESTPAPAANEADNGKKVGKFAEALIRTGFTVAHGVILAPALALPVCAAGAVVAGTMPILAAASVPLLGKIAAGFIALHAAPLALALTALPCAIPVNVFQTIQGMVYDKLGFENTMTSGSSYSNYNNSSDSSDGNLNIDLTGKTRNNHSNNEGGFNIDLTGMSNGRGSSSGSSGSGFDFSMLGGFSHK